MAQQAEGRYTNGETIEEQGQRERECIHRRHGAAGGFYAGEAYLKQLQRLRGEAAVEISRKVGAFFWSDAPHIRVWLCADCAAEVGL